LKIVLIGPVFPYRGGIAHYTTSLALALAQRHELSVISFSRQYPRWLYPGRSDKDPSKETLQVEAEYLLDPFNPISWWRTGQKIRSLKPDILILQWWVTLWAPAFTAVSMIARWTRIPVMFLIHNVLPHEERQWDRQLARLTLRTGRFFLVHTQREKQRLLSLIPRAKVAVNAHPVYDMFTKGRLPRDAARDRLGFTEDTQLILFFGIVRRYKGLKFLVDAIAELHKRGSNIYLLIAGEFWEDKTEYLQYIERLNLSAHVRIDDRYIPNEEVGIYLSAVNALVAPYVGGTQSGSITLALAFGLPLIITDQIAASIKPTQRGIVHVVPSGDVKSLADAIEEVITNPPLSKDLSSTPKNDWSQLVDVIEELIDEFISSAKTNAKG
jgi:glycosyltransferase involved in cell wall biosynthesis